MPLPSWNSFLQAVAIVLLAGCSESALPYRCEESEAAGWRVIPAVTTANLLGIWGDQRGNLYAVGEMGTVLHSADRGLSWALEPSGTTSTLSAVWFDDSGDRWIASWDGGLLHADAIDSLWKTVISVPYLIIALWGNSAGGVFAIGASGGGRNVFLSKLNSKSPWQIDEGNDVGITSNLVPTGIRGDNSGHLFLTTVPFVASEIGILRALEPGREWRPALSGHERCRSLDVTPDLMVLAACAPLSGSGISAIRTSDGGDHWQEYPSHVFSYPDKQSGRGEMPIVRSIRGLGSSEAVAVGLKDAGERDPTGFMIHYKSMDQLCAITSAADGKAFPGLYGLWSSPTELVAVGAHGAIYRKIR